MIKLRKFLLIYGLFILGCITTSVWSLEDIKSMIYVYDNGMPFYCTFGTLEAASQGNGALQEECFKRHEGMVYSLPDGTKMYPYLKYGTPGGFVLNCSTEIIGAQLDEQCNHLIHSTCSFTCDDGLVPLEDSTSVTCVMSQSVSNVKAVWLPDQPCYHAAPDVVITDRLDDNQAKERTKSSIVPGKKAEGRRLPLFPIILASFFIVLFLSWMVYRIKTGRWFPSKAKNKAIKTDEVSLSMLPSDEDKATDNTKCNNQNPTNESSMSRKNKKHLLLSTSRTSLASNPSTIMVLSPGKKLAFSDKYFDAYPSNLDTDGLELQDETRLYNCKNQVIQDETFGEAYVANLGAPPPLENVSGSGDNIGAACSIGHIDDAEVRNRNVGTQKSPKCSRNVRALKNCSKKEYEHLRAYLEPVSQGDKTVTLEDFATQKEHMEKLELKDLRCYQVLKDSLKQHGSYIADELLDRMAAYGYTISELLHYFKERNAEVVTQILQIHKCKICSDRYR